MSVPFNKPHMTCKHFCDITQAHVADNPVEVGSSSSATYGWRRAPALTGFE